MSEDTTQQSFASFAEEQSSTEGSESEPPGSPTPKQEPVETILDDSAAEPTPEVTTSETPGNQEAESSNTEQENESMSEDNSDSIDEGDSSSGPRAAEAAAIAGMDEPEAAVVTESDSSGTQGVDKDLSECDWKGLFPYAQPYEQQIDAIEQFLDILADNGWYSVEGACGTGKTLISLVAGLHAIRNNAVEVGGKTRTLPDYSRITAVTPVKQQITQFVDEARTINDNLPDGEDPAKTLVLRGMTDLMAYSRADNLEFGEELQRRLQQASDGNDDLAEQGSFRQQVSSIRETARELIKEGSAVNLEWDIEPSSCDAGDCRRLTDGPTINRCPFHQNNDDDSEGPWYDQVRAERVSELIANTSGTRMMINGTATPYPAEIPTVRDVIPYGESPMSVSPDDPFDPFYARAVAGNLTVRFSEAENHVLDGDALVELSAGEGFCPHTVMARMMDEAEIIIGNYNHLFDPETRALTKDRGGILDEETIAVVDEGHMVEDRARNLLSDEVSIYRLLWARNDVREALEIANGIVGPNSNETAQNARETAQDILDEATPEPVTRDELEETLEFIDWVIDTTDDIVGDYLMDEYHDWPAAIGEGRPAADSVSLQEPGANETDDLTERLHQSKFSEGYLGKLLSIGDVVSEIHRETNVSNRETVIGNIGELFFRWTKEDNQEFFREINLEHSVHQNPPGELPDWTERLNASLHLYNCIPNRLIGTIYQELGGGICMSATLEPMQAYKQAAGLDLLEEGVDDTFSDNVEGEEGPANPNLEGGRRVDDDTYGLQFPEENRGSWTVTLPKFTYRKRGDPTTDYEEMSDTRQQYASALKTIGNSHGNILIGMPNYREAEWAVEYLEEHTSKEIYHDQSSTDEETTELLSQFFDTGGILITSSLGTVTEGVDYDGDKLHTAAVIGVPFKNTQADQNQAVIEAYDQQLSTETTGGFDLSVGIPAVRKARQAIGRVLRGPDEVGTRIFVDERYADTGKYNVGQYLSDDEFEEFQTVAGDMLSFALQQFWEDH